MLTELRIQNLAVVEDVTLEFAKGLNVLTGSTGAGKSLILGAVNVLLGDRVGADAIRRGEAKAVVEGSFAATGLPADRVWPSMEAGAAVRLRREIHRTGRGLAFVNGVPCTLRQLRDLARVLIEPHGQNEQLRLRDPASHVVYLDRFAGSDELLAGYRSALADFEKARARLAELDSRMAALAEKKELMEHRLAEIERVGPAEGERGRLEDSIRLLEHAREVFDAVTQSTALVFDDESAAVTLIARARRALSKVDGLAPGLGELSKRLEEAEVLLGECVADMRSFLAGLEFEPGDLARMHERLDVLLSLERRHRMPVDELIVESRRWREELDTMAFGEEESTARSNDKRRALERLALEAGRLGRARRDAAVVLDRRMTRELQDLMLKGSSFRTDVTYVLEPGSELRVDGAAVCAGPAGVDDVVFCVRTNPGENEGKLDEIASSGELSRIALALKKVLSTGREGCVLVFDELDAGLGADMGDLIAKRLQELSRRYQIVCVTHMPQIAARAERHLLVTKANRGGRTIARVHSLAAGERVEEIARMLGGKGGSEKRLALAREILQLREKTPPDIVRP